MRPRAARLTVLCSVLIASWGTCFAASAADVISQTELVGHVAIFKDDIPPSGAPASPDYLARVLAEAGWQTSFLNAEQLAGASVFNHERFDLLVLPYGASFPRRAADNFRRFLREGGKFFSTGGYAFDNLLERTARGWAPPGPPPPQTEQAIWRCSLPAAELRGRGKLTFSGFLKAAGVEGPGMAYFAIYQYSAENGIVEWLDLCKVRGTQDWQQFRHTFSVHANAARVEFHAGLYRCSGTAWFDDVQLVDETGNSVLAIGFEEDFAPDGNRPREWHRTPKHLCDVQEETTYTGRRALKVRLNFKEVQEDWLNTRHGNPQDGLETGPGQLGVFQADYLLEGVQSARAVSEQAIVPRDLRLNYPLAGYAACGVVGFENARWVPLIYGYDGYGRLRGAVGGLLRHYAGVYAGSSWAIFGVTNRNLFAETEPGMARAFAQTARSLLRDAYITWLTPELACYRPGETVKLHAGLFNGGRQERRLRLTVSLFEREPSLVSRLQAASSPNRLKAGHQTDLPTALSDPDGIPGRAVAQLEVPITVTPRQTQQTTVDWNPPGRAAVKDFYYVLARLWEGDEEIDRFASGVLFRSPETTAGGPRLDFRGNYLRVGGRPRFLFGTDDWGYVFTTRRETPLQWLRDMRQRSDFGVQIYENLQFGMLPPFTPDGGAGGPEEVLRKLDGIIQLAQKYRQVYFAGLLVGANTAAGDDELARQRAYCRDFARRYAGVPGLVYYLNGDLRCQLGPEVTAQWNKFLRQRYGTTEELRNAWGPRAPNAELGQIPVEDFQDWTRSWDDVQAYDLNRFRASLIRRWHTALVGGIHEADTAHPTTSEFYQLPHGGVDLPAAIDGLDLANFGFFEKPGADLARFPLLCQYNDQRARGKSNGPGEYGVKTHPAWGDGKDYGYHIARTPEQAIDLFLAVPHYSLGLGASRIHNWCWKDDAHRVFPWGMIYPCDGVPKPIAFVHRNQSLLFRQFAPVYREPNVYLLTADTHRLGGGKWQVIEGILKGIDLALAAHIENLGTLNEDGLVIPASARVIFYPLPFCPSDAAYSQVRDWVKAGGVLYLSGDISYDEFRRRTKTERLQELCGVRFVAERYPNIAVNVTNAADQPCIRVEPTAATVLKNAADGSPCLLEHRLGKGRVLFTPDPVELHSVPARRQEDLALYRRVLAVGGVKPIGLVPDNTLIHAFRVPLEDGGQVSILFNTDESETAKTVTVTGLQPQVRLSVARRRPALVWFDGQASLRAVEAGQCALDGETVVRDATGCIVFSLDARDLRDSEALLLMPLRPGAMQVSSRRSWQKPVLLTGEIYDGKWRTLEQKALPKPASGSPITLDLRPEQALSLLLITEDQSVTRSIRAVDQAMK